MARTEGEKEVFSGLVGAAFGALVAAAIALWQQRESEDALRRQTIAARLDGLRWRAFDEIGP